MEDAMDDQAAALFAAQGTGALPDHPALNGGRCKACGYIFFPMQHYGCERSGSEELEPWLVGGRGRVVASAEVHVSMNPRERQSTQLNSSHQFASSIPSSAC